MKIVNASVTPSAGQAARYSRFDALGGGATPALDVGALPAVAGDPAIGAFAGGVGTLTFSGGGGFVFARATPVAPFNADIGLSFSLTDGDGVVVGAIDGSAGANPVQFGTTAAAGNGMAFVGGARAVRFGRLRLQSANGSERLPLPMRVSARYWNGTGFVANALDSCTTLSAANVALGNYRGNLTAGETTVSVPAATLAGGVGSLRFSAPGAGNEGSVDVSLNLGAVPAGASCLGGMGASTGANLSWLQGPWCGAAYDDDPSARATFGLYRASDRIIYRRENY
jgi:MSHA biogenesis protein MshQ